MEHKAELALISSYWEAGIHNSELTGVTKVGVSCALLSGYIRAARYTTGNRLPADVILQSFHTFFVKLRSKTLMQFPHDILWLRRGTWAMKLANRSMQFIRQKESMNPYSDSDQLRWIGGASRNGRPYVQCVWEIFNVFLKQTLNGDWFSDNGHKLYSMMHKMLHYRLFT